MKITAKKQSIMEDGKEVRSLFYMVIDNEQGQTLTINVGEKTYKGVEKLNELTLDNKGKLPKK